MLMEGGICRELKISARSHILRYHDRCTASLIKERGGILLSQALLDAVFCIEATFVMGDWNSRTGTKRKVARLGVDEHWLFAFWIRVGPPHGGFVELCQAR